MDQRSAARILLTALSILVPSLLLIRPADVIAEDLIYIPQHVVDLSYALHEDFPWIEAPGTFAFSMEPIATIETAGVAANRWMIHEHLGTQIDAPAHFMSGGRTLDQLRADELFAPIALIDFTARALADVDAEITIATLTDWESKHDRIPDGAIVIMNSGWSQRIEDPVAYLNYDAAGTKHFPGFSVEAVEWLAEHRDIWGLGVDTISFDPGYDNTYRTHKALARHDRWAIEAMSNLDKLPAQGATLFVGAVNVRDATGGLIRPVAVWSNTALDKPLLPVISGRWQSENFEPLPILGGGRRYLLRNFEFDGQVWAINFTVHADDEKKSVLYHGRNEGRYRISTEPLSSSLFAVQFEFAARTLTPEKAVIAEALTQAGCGSEPWEVGVGQDVLAEGCEAFRVASQQACGTEYDVLKIAGGKLFLGQRPADFSLCSPHARPVQAGIHPLVRTAD